MYRECIIIRSSSYKPDGNTKSSIIEQTKKLGAQNDTGHSIKSTIMERNQEIDHESV